MNFEERMAKIKAHAIAEEEKKKKIAEAEEKRWNDAEESIWKLGPRIAELIDLANACLKNGIVPCKVVHGEYNRFQADGIYHWLGFNFSEYTLRNKQPIEELAIENGGACGNTDLRVGRDGIAHGYINTDYFNGSRYTKPRTQDMEKFLREFDEFEKMFLDFVDNL